MRDWKEGLLREYHILERAKQMVEEEILENPVLSLLRLLIEDAQRQLTEREKEYREDIRNCDWEMQKIREDLVERWDIDGKYFKCNIGSIAIRTTRSLKVDDKETLISTLLHIGKLTQCITGWDLAYLRKLADAELFKGADVVHYDEKKNVVISGAKNRENVKDEE